jgi:hypothetical protein
MAVTVPLKVDVVLVGLDGSGALGERQDDGALQRLLSHSLGSVCPVLAGQRRRSRACFSVQVQVSHAHADIQELESVMALSMVRSKRSVGLSCLGELQHGPIAPGGAKTAPFIGLLPDAGSQLDCMKGAPDEHAA